MPPSTPHARPAHAQDPTAARDAACASDVRRTPRTLRTPRRRRSATPVGAALLATLLASGLAGCGAAAEPPVSPTASPVRSADCLDADVLATLGLAASAETDAAEPVDPVAPDAHASSEPAGEATAGAVPEGFVPVTALQCLAGATLLDSQGTWLAVTAVRLEGDLGAVLDALGSPDDGTVASGAPSDATAPTCAAGTGAAWEVWLVDALGRAVRPVLARDACGQVGADLDDAVAALTETDRTDYPVLLVAPDVDARHAAGVTRTQTPAGD